MHYFLQGDDTTALNPLLVKPYSRRQLIREEGIENCRVSRGWTVVENMFGILASRSRVLLGTMEQRPQVVRDLVLTCIVLHNMLKTHKGRVARAPNAHDKVPTIVNDPVVYGG